ncbi:hypothetical protein KP509_10G066100 [Ceratopteris richardii]|uniref:Uncharacterized protein n=1 Tax=Ceratopteris richardii TaxID=49495 RepID=A0A8T2U2A9_CERRI|nr:hypothetical protein KP509_10G066100 [Ceratopteris richardii]
MRGCQESSLSHASCAKRTFTKITIQSLLAPAPVQYKMLSLPQQMVTWQETWRPEYAVAFLYVYCDDVSLLLYFSLAGSQVHNNGSPPDSSMMRFLARVLIQILSFEYITIAVTLVLMLLREQKFLLHLKSMFPFQVCDPGGINHDYLLTSLHSTSHPLHFCLRGRESTYKLI